MADEGYDLSFWRDKNVLVTGHTGFIGSWLSFWLCRLGAKVAGFALPPATSPSLFAQLKLNEALTASHTGDIADREALRRVIDRHQPEIIFHLAAQAIVGQAHKEPFETWRVNALGTVALLETAAYAQNLRSLILFTTDKVYANDETGRAYREDDRLGGDGIYDSSKSACELTAHAFAQHRLRHLGLATVRAGNVIGGGDWAADRLVPDCIRAFQSGRPVELRHPRSVRPWQHVLDVCDATLRLAYQLHHAPHRACGAWNIGPDEQAAPDAAGVAEQLARHFGLSEAWRLSPDAPAFPEANLLRLDAGKFRNAFGWRPVLPVQDALDWTARWYADCRDGRDPASVTAGMLLDYTGKRHLPDTRIAAKDRA